MAEEKTQVSINDFLRKRTAKTRELNFEGFKSPLVIKEITNEENEGLQKAASVSHRNKAGQLVKDTDSDKYTGLLLSASVVQPDLTNKELQQFYGTLGDPAATLKAMLSMGEFNKLAEAVTELSGLDKTLDDEVKEAKK